MTARADRKHLAGWQGVDTNTALALQLGCRNEMLDAIEPRSPLTVLLTAF